MCNLTLIQKFNDCNKFQSQFFFVCVWHHFPIAAPKRENKTQMMTEKNQRFSFFLLFVQCRSSTSSERGPKHDATTAVLASWYCVRRLNTSTHSTGACSLRFQSVYLLIMIFFSFKKHLACPCRQLQIVSSSRSKALLFFFWSLWTSVPHQHLIVPDSFWIFLKNRIN